MTWKHRLIRPVTALTVGHVTHDRYGESLLAGGCAFYGAQAMRALGARSRLVTAVGADFCCDDALEGLEVSRGRGPKTTTFENIYLDGRPRLQWLDALAPSVTPNHLPAEWRRPDVLFIAPVCGELTLRDWLDAIESPVVGLGLQGLLKQPTSTACADGRSAIVPRRFALDRKLMRRLDAVFLSDEDLEQFGAGDIFLALREVVPVLVLTSGHDGCRVYTRGGEDRVGIFPVHATDPTGAGDTFAGAFLFGLAQGASAVDAARLASAAASIVVEASAGTRLLRVRESYERADAVPVFGSVAWSEAK